MLKIFRKIKRKLYIYLKIFITCIGEARLYLEYMYITDIEKYNKQKLLATIIANYHVIEKGLTMPNMRFRYGKLNVLNTIRLCELFIEKFGKENSQVKFAIAVVDEYIRVHKEENVDLDINIVDNLKKIKKNFNNERIISEHHEVIKGDEYFSKINNRFPDFALSRHSVRNFSKEDIPEKDIERALLLAESTPSSCNRQPTRVKVIKNKKTIDKILALQRGNRGFGHLTNKLLVICTDISVYNGIEERNCIYVDSGIYSMNLLYALHYYKICACALNASLTIHEERKMKELLNLPKEEVISLIIACGKAPPEFKIAKSLRSNFLQKTKMIES